MKQQAEAVSYYICPQCHFTIMDSESLLCDRCLRLRHDKWLKIAPKRYQNCHIDDLEDDIQKRFQVFIEFQPSIMFICGDYGTGKTYAALAVAKKVIESNQSVHYCRAQDIVQDLHVDPFLYRSQRWLIIDDVHSLSAFFESQRATLIACLMHRFDAMLPSLLISNVAADSLQSLLSGALVDRILRCGDLVQFTRQWR